MIFTTSKKMIVAGVVTLSILTAGIPAAMAEEEAPSADASVAFLSKYVWRGFELSDDSMVIQPSLTASYMGFSANFWGNLDTKYYETEAHNWNETDFTLSYDGAYEKLGYGRKQLDQFRRGQSLEPEEVRSVWLDSLPAGR